MEPYASSRPANRELRKRQRHSPIVRKNDTWSRWKGRWQPLAAFPWRSQQPGQHQECQGQQAGQHTDLVVSAAVGPTRVGIASIECETRHTIVSGRVSGEALLLHLERNALMVCCVDLSGRWSGEGMVDRQLVHGQHAQRNSDGAYKQQQLPPPPRRAHAQHADRLTTGPGDPRQRIPSAVRDDDALVRHTP